MGEVKIREFEFLSSNNYYTIHGKMWIPEGEIKAIVQISHGMAEYIDRYDEFAKYLASNGILAVGNDHMGHGESVNSKDDLGYFSIPIKGMPSKYKDKFTSGALAVKDLYRITRQVKKHYPGIYFRKGERPSCLKCKWHYEKSGSLCQGLARCNAKTYRRIK